MVQVDVYILDYKCFVKTNITVDVYEMLNSLQALDVLRKWFLSNTVPDKGVTYDFV